VSVDIAPPPSVLVRKRGDALLHLMSPTGPLGKFVVGSAALASVWETVCDHTASTGEAISIGAAGAVIVGLSCMAAARADYRLFRNAVDRMMGDASGMVTGTLAERGIVAHRLQNNSRWVVFRPGSANPELLDFQAVAELERTAVAQGVPLLKIVSTMDKDGYAVTVACRYVDGRLHGDTPDMPGEVRVSSSGRIESRFFFRNGYDVTDEIEPRLSTAPVPGIAMVVWQRDTSSVEDAAEVPRFG
jgi:hypothetical protein